MTDISIDEFRKLDLRIGKIIAVEDVPKSRTLYKLLVDFGFEKRQAVAGIKPYYKPDELINRKFVFLLNIERRKIMGVESQCMILAAENGKGAVALLQPIKDVKEGSRVK